MPKPYSLRRLNLAAHAPGLAGRSCHHLHLAANDPGLADRLGALLDGAAPPVPPVVSVPDAPAGPADDSARAALAALAGRRVGRLGEPPAGFDTCAHDPDLLRALFGLAVDELDLAPAFARARAVPPAALADLRGRAARELDGLDAVDAAAADRSLALYAALRDLSAERGLAALAVRCWPETFTELGCAACRPLAMPSEDGMPAACEADVPGAVTGLLLQALAGEPPWLVDLVDLDPADGTGVVWHCGLAPAPMCDPAAGPRADSTRTGGCRCSRPSRSGPAG